MLLGSRRAVQGLCLVHLASLTALLLPSSSTLSTVAAHSKIYCTDAIVVANQLQGCRSYSSPLSRPVHVWGRNPTDPTIPKDWKDSLPKMLDGHFLLTDATVLHIRNLTTGYMPHTSQMALVEPGGKLVWNWSTNGHGFPNYVFREPSGATVTASTPEPSFAEWTDPKHLIGKFSYRTPGSVADPPAALGGTRCNKPPLGGYGGLSPLGQLLQQNGHMAGSTETNTCFATLTIPLDMPKGINRLLYYWHHHPNDAHFFDAIYINVQPNAAALRQATPTPVVDSLEMQSSPADAQQFRRTIRTSTADPYVDTPQSLLREIIVPLVYRAPEPRQLLIEVRKASNSELVGTFKRPLYPSLDGRVAIRASFGPLPELTELITTVQLLDAANVVKAKLPKVLRTTITDNEALIGEIRAAQDLEDRLAEAEQVKTRYDANKAGEEVRRLKDEAELATKLATLTGEAKVAAEKEGKIELAINARDAAKTRATFIASHANAFNAYQLTLQATIDQAVIDLSTQPARTAAAAAAYAASIPLMPTLANLTQHSRPDIDCWTLIGGRVLDLTDFAFEHPGGALVLKPLCGRNGTAAFLTQHLSLLFMNQVLATGDVREIELRPTDAEIALIKKKNFNAGKDALIDAKTHVTTSENAFNAFAPVMKIAATLKISTQVELKDKQALLDALNPLPNYYYYSSSSSSSSSTGGADTYQFDADQIAQAKESSSSTGREFEAQTKPTISGAQSILMSQSLLALLSVAVAAAAALAVAA